MDQEVKNLLGKQVIETYQNTMGYFSPIFVVPKKGERWRPIINLKSLNRYLHVHHLKMENVYSVPENMKQGLYGKNRPPRCLFQCKDLSLPAQVPQFQWKEVAYQYRALPFGLATAPRVFLKIMREAVSHLREKGIGLVQYLDDILIMGESREQLTQHARCDRILAKLRLPVKHYIISEQQERQTTPRINPLYTKITKILELSIAHGL